MASRFEQRAKALLPSFLWKIIRYQIIGRSRWLREQGRQYLLGRARDRILRHQRESRVRTNKVYYPNRRDGGRWFSKLMFPSEDGRSGWCAQYYKRDSKVRNDHTRYMDYPPAEVLYVTRHEDSARLEMEGEGVLPVSARRPEGASGGPFSLKTGGRTHRVSDFEEERFYWLKIPEAGEVEVDYPGGELFVGAPAVHTGSRDRRSVLTIFIDGCSSLFFDYEPLSTLMPETHRFFSEGTIFRNCHATGEWTLPSVSTMFTGLHTHRHGMFHPHSGPLHRPENRLMSEHFRSAGYFTGQVGGNWRKNPAQGYGRGFDRTIYHHGIDVSEVYAEFMDHLEGFSHMDQFNWLTLHDLHHRFYGVPTVDSMTRIEPDSWYSEPTEEKSVRVEFDINAVRRALHELRRIDRYLGMIYRHMLDRFGDEEMLVALVADHGQSYLAEDTHILSDKRIRVPLMVRGRGIPRAESAEWVQNTDILPALHHLAGLSEPLGDIDGQLPAALGGESERDYVFAESLYPEQTYKCVFKGREGKFIFETEEKTGEDGWFDRESIRCVAEPEGGRLAGRGAAWYLRRLKRYLEQSVLPKESDAKPNPSRP